MIKCDWKLPSPPADFPLAIAVYHSDGTVTLDWSRHPQRDFASEHGMGAAIDWPFVDGTQHVRNGRPDVVLWESVGILPIW